MIDSLINSFDRNLEMCKSELNAFSDEDNIWKITHHLNNSSGNLALHIAGNLQHFFGAVIGKDDYIRDRNAEFELTDVPKEKIIQELEKAKISIRKTLENISPEELKMKFPINVLNQNWTTEQFFIFLHGHLSYHLGQINYLRRFLEQKN